MKTQALNKSEKIDVYWKALNKSGSSVALYYHFKTIKNNWYKKIKESD
jgi:hypothetical protein